MIKFCKDCQFCARAADHKDSENQLQSAKCLAARYTETNIVSGTTSEGYYHCTTERSRFGDCGKYGANFRPIGYVKPPSIWQRLRERMEASNDF